MGVVMFAMVKLYPHGVRNPSVDYALNISHVAGFRQLSFVRESDQEDVPYVVVDCRHDLALAIDGTMDDLFASIKRAEALVQTAAYPYGPPIEPLRSSYERS